MPVLETFSRSLTTCEGETVDLLLDMLRSDTHHVVFVDTPGGELERRLKQLLKHHSGIEWQTNRSGWHLFRDKNLIFVPNLHYEWAYDWRHVTDYVLYRFPWDQSEVIKP